MIDRGHGRGGTGRRGRIAAATALVVALAGVALAGLAVPALAAGPSVTVSPASGLRSGQSVTVSGTGFTPNVSQLIVVQCAASATGSNACNVSNVQFTKTDATGSFRVSLVVASRFASTDCTKVECIVQAHEGINPSTGSTGTSAPLLFGASAPPVAPAPTSTAPAAPISLPAASGVPSTTTAAPTTHSTAPSSPTPSTSTSYGVLAALPTAADSGWTLVGGVPLLSEIGAGLAALLLALAVGLHYRRPRRGR